MKTTLRALLALVVVMGCTKTEPITSWSGVDSSAEDDSDKEAASEEDSKPAAGRSSSSDKKPEMKDSETKDSSTKKASSTTTKKKAEPEPEERAPERSDSGGGDPADVGAAAATPGDATPASGVGGMVATGGGGSGPRAGEAGSPAPVEHAIVGKWLGMVVDSAGPMFNLCMAILQISGPGVAGTTSYFGSVNCGGEISYAGLAGDIHTFTETITRGRGCIPAGRIEARLNSDDTLDWEWFETGRAVPRETSTMRRVAACP